VRPNLVLGRGGDCDLVFDDPQISRHHARLTWEAGNWFVEDLGSTNGTKVNGMAVADRKHLLNMGGLLSLGGVVFQLRSGLEDTMVAPHSVPQPIPRPPSRPADPAPAPAAPPYVPARTGGSSSLTLGVFLLLGLLLMAAIGLAAWVFLSPAPEAAAGLQARIDAPANGSEVVEGNVLTISASAADGEQVSRLEIWIDGVLAQSTASTTPAIAVTYLWTAQGPGSHVILARAYNQTGQASDAIVTVQVAAGAAAAPSPTSEQAAVPGPTAAAATPETLLPTDTPTPETASPTPPAGAADSVPPTATLAPQVAPLGVFYDFETPRNWRRGDQPNGTLELSDAQTHSGSRAGRLNYNFPGGGNDFVVFLWQQALDGNPNRLNVWVHGDGTGHYLNAWIKDNGGQTWQFSFGQVKHTGWRQMSAYLDVDQPWPAGHIAGPDNGAVDYPISFYGLVLDDAPDAFSGSGTVYVDDLESVLGSGRPAATPTATPPPPTTRPGASIDFRADRTTLRPDECTTLRWDVENVREVYLDGDGVAGHDSRRVCPSANRTYTLRVVLTDGTTTERTVTIVVTAEGSPPAAPSNLTVAIAMSNGFGLSFKDNSGGAAEGFRLYNADNASLMQEYPLAAAPNLPISGLECGRTYRMALTAFNAFGESGPSNVVQGATQSCP
jgi:hypothetical protein